MTAGTQRLRVDWPTCRAHGLCHELLPELIRLDEWGYPVIGGEVPADLIASARSAARACPRRALHVSGSSTPRSG